MSKTTTFTVRINGINPEDLSADDLALLLKNLQILCGTEISLVKVEKVPDPKAEAAK